MKKGFFFLVLMLFSCSKIVEKPENLLPKEQMAQIIADFSVYDQGYSVSENVNMEMASRYVLKKHRTDAKTFRSSYQYYLSQPEELTGILERAQEVLLEKDPKLEEYIKKHQKKNPHLPTYVR